MDTGEKPQIEEEEIKYEDSDSYRKQAEKFNQSEVEDIQLEIQEVTKLIEHEKINLRISNERYEKQFVKYSELQGKPIPKNKDQKEKEKREAKELQRSRKLADPPAKKTTKDKEIQESRVKTLKEISKNETDLEFLTGEINEIVLTNQDLKEQIADLRKQKKIISDQRDMIIESNKEKEKEIERLQKMNEIGEGKINSKRVELTKSVDKGENQQKYFRKNRDELEGDYHSIIEEFIKREREQKKEQAKKRQILAMVADSKSTFKGSNAIELENQIKLMANEEISDRTPILEQIVNKWKSINKVKKYMIEKYENNSIAIKQAFQGMMEYLQINQYEDLPIIFKKAMNQMANINIYSNQLENENVELYTTKMLLQDKIKYLSNRKNSVNQTKSSFAEEKQGSIDALEKRIATLEEDINRKRKLFLRLQPGIDEYLGRLNQTYLSEYIPNKLQIDSHLKYSETSIEKFISNVEDYFKLIQMFEEGINEGGVDPESRELDRLRLEIKTKLDNYEKDKVLGNNFYVTMKSEAKSGLDYTEIIKRSSELIMNNVNSPFTSPSTTLKKKSAALS